MHQLYCDTNFTQVLRNNSKTIKNTGNFYNIYFTSMLHVLNYSCSNFKVQKPGHSLDAVFFGILSVPL